MNKIIYSLKYFSLTMDIKYEIKVHDGPGRLNRILLNNGIKKTLESPLLASPQSIPPFHKSEFNKETLQPLEKQNDLIIGYLPPLHTFSTYDSNQDVINILKEKIFPKINKIVDIICFPLDRASSYRTESHYPEFIDAVRKESSDLNFTWIFSESDTNPKWNIVSDMPLIILGDAATLYTKQRRFYRYIKSVHQNFPFALKYCPNIPPILIPILAYLGIDVFDTLYGNFMANNNIFLDWNDHYKIDDLSKFDPPCSCTSCFSYPNFESKTQWLRSHNEYLTRSIVKKVKLSIKAGKLRDLVKQFILSDPSLTALIRIADLDNDDNLLERYNPTLKKQALLLTAYSDFIRPEVKLFQKRLKERFSVPQWVEAIILIPCSAKKPYSDSKSHKIMSSAIKRILKAKRFNVLELIVTSPLGIVPRFLENVYPAVFYDIPVTGNWSSIEEQFVEELLLSIYRRLTRKIPIISYLEEPEKGIISNINDKNPELNIDVIDIANPETSIESLTILKEHLVTIKTKLNYEVSKNMFQLEQFRAMADYQFGNGVGIDLFPDNTIVKFKSMLLSAFLENKQLASLHKGYISLTAFGASMLVKSSTNYRVYFDEEKINGSAIYTPGISKADHSIRPNDTVLVFSAKNDKLLGIGQSFLNGNELESLTYGIGITIKKKIK